MLRIVMLLIGLLSLAIGILGVILPVLPTTPFILVAAALFAKSSTKFHNYLKENKYFGPMIKNWEENRTIPTRAIVVSILLMSISALASVAYFVCRVNA